MIAAAGPERAQVRKVRASQGRMPANGRRRRLPGKCNREQTASRAPARKVRVKGQCKRLPAAWQQGAHCKPHPKQDRTEDHGLPVHVLRWVA